MQIARPYRDLWWWLHTETPPYRYYCYSGGRASGKSTAVAQSLILRAASQPITVLCAREFQNSITDSVHKLLVGTIRKFGLQGFEITRDGINHINGSTFIFRGLHNNLQSIKSIEGVDVCWVEEAQTISDTSLTTLIPTIRKTNSTLIFTWNPLTSHDAVWTYFVTSESTERHKQTCHWHTTFEDVERLLSPDVLAMIEADRESADFGHIWLGLPYSDTDNQLISDSMLNEAIHRTPEDGPVTFGVDVARYGNDRTALTIKKGNRIETLESWTHSSIVDTGERIRLRASQYHPIDIRIDDTGVGGGLTDLLKSWQLPVTGINYAGKAKDPQYPGIASELWFDFAAMLPQLSINPQLADLAKLTTELTTRKWQITSRNQRQIESKQDYKDSMNLGSPDLADSVLLACYEPPKLPSWDVMVC
nr:MAG: terminase [Bacteriophage sp.]